MDAEGNLPGAGIALVVIAAVLVRWSGRWSGSSRPSVAPFLLCASTGLSPWA